MIEIKVNDEIRDVSAEFVLGLNLREFIWTSIGVLMGTITGILLYLKFHMPIAILVYISVIPVVPFAFIAFFSYHGLTFIELMKILISILLTKKEKVYSCMNLEYMSYEENKKKGKKRNGFKNTSQSCSE